MALPGQQGHIGPEAVSLASTIILLQQMEILPNQYDPDDRMAPIETRLHTKKYKYFGRLQKVTSHQWTVHTGAVSVTLSLVQKKHN